MKKFMLTALFLCVLLSGCVPTVGVDQNTLDTLNKAIDALNAQPGAWNFVLKDTIDHLADKTTEVAKQVQKLLNDSIAFVGVEARCNVDFLGVRLRDSLIYIRDKILLGKSNSPLPTPWVCHFNPDTLDLKWNANQGHWETTEPIIKVFGFNFSYVGLPRVELHDANNQLFRQANVTPTYNTTYELQLNFQTEDFNAVAKGFRYYLKWGNADPNGLSVVKEVVPDPPCNIPTVPPSDASVSCGKIPYGFVYYINQPNVKQRETPYPQVPFMTGERVTIDAGGCVQTGGAGATWKLYVNPQGPNADRLYHGLIRIPGVTQGLQRIQDVMIGRTFVVGNVAPGNNTLALGYEDDDYSDNGYYSHDDGTGNQCLGVGPAWVKITIQLSIPK